MPEIPWSERPMGKREVEKILGQITSIPPAEFYAIEDDLRRAAFTMSKINDAAILNRIKRQIALYVKAGWNEAQFAAWLEGQAVTWNAAYSRLVFRNATQNAYNHARFKIHFRPGNAKRYPVLIYDAVMDAETSDFCAAHNGKWWHRQHFPKSLYPPNHHNCRSIVRMATKTTAAKLNPNDRLQGKTKGPQSDPPWPGKPPDGWQYALRKRRRILERGLGIGG
jgi:hypothetical protein